MRHSYQLDCDCVRCTKERNRRSTQSQSNVSTRTISGHRKGYGRRYNNTPTREQRILEHGYQAYAREEGHYDFNGDN